MKKIILFVFIFFAVLVGKAQSNFDILYNQGVQQQKKGLYYKAIKSYNAAILYTSDKTKKEKAKTKIDFCAKKLEGLRTTAENALKTAKVEKQKAIEAQQEAEQERQKAEDALKIAEQERQKAEDALKIAEQEKLKAEIALNRAKVMQAKVETAMFDKAVKERNDRWQGYVQMWNAEEERNEILATIDSLDLRNNKLLCVPEEVLECPNLKFIDLRQNKDIDWKGAEKILQKLGENVDVYISIENIDSVPKHLQSKITGIELLNVKLKEIPENILRQKQLKYLKINAKISKLSPEIENLTNLTKLDLEYSQLKELPKEIGKLSSLKELNLARNQLKHLPVEIGNLKKLEKLYLSKNQLKRLPNEIGGLKSLKELDLRSNKLKKLPREIGNLWDLEILRLTQNQLDELPKTIGRLRSLMLLSLSENQIEKLPYEIFKLNKLEKVFLGGNKIEKLPTSMAKFNNLKVLYLKGLPLERKSFTEFLKICNRNKTVQITDNQSKWNNDNNEYVRIIIDKIEFEWKKYKFKD